MPNRLISVGSPHPAKMRLAELLPGASSSSFTNSLTLREPGRRAVDPGTKKLQSYSSVSFCSGVSPPPSPPRYQRLGPSPSAQLPS